MTLLLAFSDESGKEPRSRAYLQVTVTFEIDSLRQFEQRIWQWRSEKDAPKGEVKIRKYLETRAGKALGLDSWRAVVRDVPFNWFATCVPWDSFRGRQGGGRHRHNESRPKWE